MNPDDETMLIAEPWPKTIKINTDKASEFDGIQQIVKETRAIKNTLDMKKGSLLFTDSNLVQNSTELIARLANLEGVREVKKGWGIRLTQTSENAWIDTDDKTAKKFVSTLNNREKELDGLIKNLKKRLKNKSYVSKAPAHLILETKDQLTAAETEHKTVKTQISKYI